MSISQQSGQFHPLPVIGHPEAYYVKHIRLAEQSQDVHAREAHKVGRYVTLGLDPNIPWDEKLRYFRHALKHHCLAPDGAAPEVEAFYGKLTELIRRYAGHEALRLAKGANDSYRVRLEHNSSRDEIKSEAAAFFDSLLGHRTDELCPSWMGQDAWDQIRALRSRWV